MIEVEYGPGGAFRFVGVEEYERLYPGRTDYI